MHHPTEDGDMDERGGQSEQTRRANTDMADEERQTKKGANE